MKELRVIPRVIPWMPIARKEVFHCLVGNETLLSTYVILCVAIVRALREPHSAFCLTCRLVMRLLKEPVSASGNTRVLTMAILRSLPL